MTSTGGDSRPIEDSAGLQGGFERAVDVRGGTPSTANLASIADGQEHRLAPRIIPAERLAGWLFAGPVSAAILVGSVGSWLAAGETFLPGGLAVLASGLLATLLCWQAHAWPAISYRHRSYRVTPLGIEIRRGVVWRTTNNIPRSRVQHTDVRQGPIERRFGLAHLIIHTAGTMSASVSLEGLQRETAVRIRNHLLASGEDDAV